MADPNSPKSLLDKAKDRLSTLATTISPSLAVQETTYRFPDFDDLPAVSGQPQGCLWGFYDRDGVRDELGSLNLLTPSVIRSAASLIRTGKRIQLDRELAHGQQFGFAYRKQFEQKIIDHGVKTRTAAFDDELSFNTQGSSQWDGLKHFAHQKTRTYYNGLSHDEAGKTDKNGIHHWSNAGGITGRGILVDWARWHIHTKGTPLPAGNTRLEIPVTEIVATLKYQNTTTKQGDILIVRSGYGAWLDSALASSPTSPPAAGQAIGLQANEESVRWLYDQHFAAVAGDALAFEAWPPVTSKKDGWCLHEWLLVQWGMPVGELWDLEGLSGMCEEHGRWEFWLGSAPLRVRGGVGTTPNAVAVF